MFVFVSLAEGYTRRAVASCVDVMDSREINSINYDSVFFSFFRLGEISYQPLTISNDADDFKMKMKKAQLK